MDAFLNTLKSLGMTKLIITGVVLATVLGASLYFVQHISTPDMALLYSDLEPAEASHIVTKLEERKTPLSLRAGGTQIYVPIDMIPKIRMELAEEGLPHGGSVGYEIFDKSEAFGSSIFVQNINRVRALEGELSRTIRTLAQISAARVHLVLPKKEIFSKDKENPSASIVLRLSTPGRLENARVQAIQHLVAAAVPGLSPQHVSIIDDRGNLLSAGDRESASTLPNKADEYRENYEARLERAIDTLVGRTLGISRVRTEVSVEMDFNRLTENSESYDPEGQVVRSTQTVQESTRNRESQTSGSLTIESELPDASEAGGAPSSPTNETNRGEETINYEISKTMRSTVKEVGAITKLSIAVLIDGTTAPDAEGKAAYQPRTPEEIENIRRLVKSAVGFDEGRGDTLEIVNMPFSNEQTAEVSDTDHLIWGFERHHIVRIAETTIMGFLGLLAVLLIAKPLIQSFLVTAEKKPVPPTSREHNDAPPPSTSPAASTPTPRPPHTTPERTLDAAQQAGENARNSSLKKITEVIDTHPEESAQMVRNWMNS